MTQLALIRHGPTDWNEEKRLQGRMDRPLSPAGRAEVESWSLPPALESYAWIASPLTRAVATAEILSGGPVTTDPRLVEMAYGDWEGLRLSDLRSVLGQEMAENEARGLDFQPPGGESPRMVAHRLKGFWAGIGAAGCPTIAVCHKGVIRASFATATGWDMKSKPATKLKNGHAHLFTVTCEGCLAVDQLNVSLAGTD